MFYNPLVDLVDRLIQKARDFASPVYWIWIFTVALIGGIAYGEMLKGARWDDTKLLWLITAAVFLLPLPAIFWHEAKWGKKRKKEVGHEPF